MVINITLPALHLHHTVALKGCTRTGYFRKLVDSVVVDQLVENVILQHLSGFCAMNGIAVLHVKAFSL